MKRGILWTLLSALVGVCGVGIAQAASYNSTNFSIDGSVGDSFGGAQTSTNYQLESLGGESVIGNGASGSYKLGYGYIERLQRSLELNVQPGSQGLYVPFDEATGSQVYDNSVNTGVPTVTGTPQWTTGKIGGAITTDSTHYVEFPKTTAVTPASALTLEAWIKPSNLSNTVGQKVISSTDGGGIALYLTGTSADICAASRVCFVIRIGGSYSFVEVNKATYLANGTWAHLVATYNGSTMKLYIDGVERATANVTGTISYSATAPLCIGAEAQPTSCSTQSFGGDIDEVKLFSRGLTASEALAEYNAQNAGIASGLSLNSITPGTSQTATYDAAVQTDAAGYSLAISQNNNLTSGGNTIPGVSGSIASPVSWSEGSTKGLGFTLFGTNATAIPGTWGSGASYAAIPGSATTFYTRTGFTAGAKDYLNMRLRLDVATSQATGNYTNQMTIVGTVTP